MVVLSRPNPIPSDAGGNVTRFPSEKRADAMLVAEAASGDQRAMVAIWDRYSGLVRGVLYGVLGPDDAIEDLVQEVFLSFMKGAHRVRDGAALRGYLASMAVRQGVQEIRRRKVRRWVGLSATGDLPDTPVSPVDLEGREVLRALYRIMERLSARRRAAFVLRHVHSLEVLEAARALQISESTFRRELVFARQFIQRAASSEPALCNYLNATGRGQ